MTAGPVIVGNALAGLVAADALDRAGIAMTLINPGGPWGGYFAGIEADSAVLDAGMVVLEFTAFAEQAGREAIAGYDALVRNDVGRFAGVVRDWCEARFACRTIDPPVMRIGGETLPDLVMGNDLTALRRMPFHATVRGDLAALPDPGPLHARCKARGPAFADAPFDVVSRANHGTTLHDRLFAPFLDAVFGVHAGSLLARYHRIPWLPLYWPETLRDVLQGMPPPIAPSPLSYPANSSVAAEVRRLTTRLATSRNVRMIEGAPASLSRGPAGAAVTLADGARVTAGQLCWSHAPAALLRLLGGRPCDIVTPRAPLALALFAARDITDPFAVLQVIEPGAGFYRITDLNSCAGQGGAEHRWVVELNLDVFANPRPADDAVVAELAGRLRAMGLAGTIRPIGLSRVPGGFAVPDGAALAAWSADHAAIRRIAPDVELMAAGSGFMVTSLADQVIQGLRFADRILAEAGQPPRT